MGVLLNTGIFQGSSFSTNSQKWEAGFAEGLGEGLPTCCHHHSNTNCPQTAVTIAVLIITGKWRPNHLAMRSKPPGAQHSNPLSSKGFPEENSTGHSLGQHFSWLPITHSQCFLLLFLLLSTHPNCPIKEQPQDPTQAATKVKSLGSFKGKRTGKVWIPPLLPISDWGPRLVCVWIRLFLICPHEVSILEKKFLPLKRESMQGQCFSNYVPPTIIGRDALYQRLSLILNWFLDYKISQMCTVSLCKEMWLLSTSSHSIGLWNSFVGMRLYRTNILQNTRWEKLSLNKDNFFFFFPTF